MPEKVTHESNQESSLEGMRKELQCNNIYSYNKIKKKGGFLLIQTLHRCDRGRGKKLKVPPFFLFLCFYNPWHPLVSPTLEPLAFSPLQ